MENTRQERCNIGVHYGIRTFLAPSRLLDVVDFFGAATFFPAIVFLGSAFLGALGLVGLVDLAVDDFLVAAALIAGVFLAVAVAGFFIVAFATDGFFAETGFLAVVDAVLAGLETGLAAGLFYLLYYFSEDEIIRTNEPLSCLRVPYVGF